MRKNKHFGGLVKLVLAVLCRKYLYHLKVFEQHLNMHFARVLSRTNTITSLGNQHKSHEELARTIIISVIVMGCDHDSLGPALALPPIVLDYLVAGKSNQMFPGEASECGISPESNIHLTMLLPWFVFILKTCAHMHISAYLQSNPHTKPVQTPWKQPKSASLGNSGLSVVIYWCTLNTESPLLLWLGVQQQMLPSGWIFSVWLDKAGPNFPVIAL